VDGFYVHEWRTYRADPSLTAITMPESEWLDLAGYMNLVVWLQVREFSLGGAAHLQMGYQSSVTKDEEYFLPLIAPFNFNLAINVQTILRETALNPLGCGSIPAA